VFFRAAIDDFSQLQKDHQLLPEETVGVLGLLEP